jgi:DNA-binding IclR family transcriptional regulator
VGGGDPGRGNSGKPLGAVGVAAKVLRTLHTSKRLLHASEVARAMGLLRSIAYNILRMLHAEGFVGYGSVSLYILELAHGVLRRSRLLGLVRSLMHAVSTRTACWCICRRLSESMRLLRLG